MNKDEAKVGFVFLCVDDHFTEAFEVHFTLLNHWLEPNKKTKPEFYCLVCVIIINLYLNLFDGI